MRINNLYSYSNLIQNKNESNKRLKIVRIIARLNVGGPTRHVVWLTRALEDDEFESILIAGSIPAGEEDMSYFAAEHAVKPIFIPEMSRELSAKDVVSLWKVWRQIEREKPDIIHTHTAKAGTIGRAAGFLYRWLTWKTFLGKPRRVRFVHTYHGHVFHSYYGNLKTKIFLFIEKALAFFSTDKIVVISNQQFGEIHEKFGVGRRSQFATISLGIDLEKFDNSVEKRSNFRSEIRAVENEIIVGFVGRLTDIKNVSLLLKVAQIYKNDKSSNLPNLRFLIIGDGNLREKLEAEADALGVRDLVRFLGNRSDTDVFYAGLDIIALTSFNEGTPLSLIEAMANEKAVVSTTVGGVVDLLGNVESERDGFQVCERGIGVRSNDAESFYNGLIYFVKDEKFKKRASENGKIYVRENYSKARLISDIKNLYRELMKN